MKNLPKLSIAKLELHIILRRSVTSGDERKRIDPKCYITSSLNLGFIYVRACRNSLLVYIQFKPIIVFSKYLYNNFSS